MEGFHAGLSPQDARASLNQGLPAIRDYKTRMQSHHFLRRVDFERKTMLFRRMAYTRHHGMIRWTHIGAAIHRQKV